MEVDPWQQQSADPTAGGADYPPLVTAMRRLQDAVAMAAPPGESLDALTARLDEIAADVEKYRADEWERYAGRRRDLPGRGHSLLLPVI
ncbi:hypothetical protein [Cryptosporangium sp. NPDC051539]|uniref:hypothetical protein n=1 Tax=Cryptosporangium sp. NPDC051539 TaxID=3363962 RepID=UPI0037A4A6AA